MAFSSSKTAICAAMAGLIVAFLGIAAVDVLGFPRGDAVASIVIGLILAATAALLSRETKGQLIGEGAQSGVRHINELLTRHLGPQEILPNTTAGCSSRPRTAGATKRQLKML